MKHAIALVGIVAALGLSCSRTDESNAGASAQGAVKVKIETSMGDIVVELDGGKAPVTARNFLAYVDKGFYDGTIIHRVESNFVIQGGGFTPDMQEKPTNPPILNEADNWLSNDRGTIAMARTDDPNSAKAQFFINLRNNTELNFVKKTRAAYGYCVFGKVIEGMDVVDKIAAVSVANRPPYANVPQAPIVIKSAKRIQ